MGAWGERGRTWATGTGPRVYIYIAGAWWGRKLCRYPDDGFRALEDKQENLRTRHSSLEPGNRVLSANERVPQLSTATVRAGPPVLPVYCPRSGASRQGR